MAADADAPSTEVPPGLVWVSDQMPGIQRLRRGSGFVYRDAQGALIRDESTLARIRRLAVPPAYRAVWICPLPHGHLQATGRDAAGRKQYRYHTRWQAERGSWKYDRLLAVGEALSRIRLRVQQDLEAQAGARPTRTVVLATLVRLLDTTFVRIGNEAYAKQNRSYGLTTLRNAHAGISGSELRLQFRGKGGIRHDLRLDDARVARVVRRCRELPGQDLFQYVDDAGEVHRIGSADVNEYLAEAAGERITAKDFRTWHGSVQALAMTLDACRCADAGQVPTATAVIAAVAQRLGNTAAVCRKAYIHPQVLELLASLGTAEARAALQRQRWAGKGLRGPARLSQAERRLLALLRANAKTRSRPLAASGP
jgi:DNA topoisomerase-1